MVTSELIEYIKKQIAKNVPESLITSKLVQIGWRAEDVVEGLEKSKQLAFVAPVEIKISPETYTPIEIPKIEEVKIEIPIEIVPEKQEPTEVIIPADTSKEEIKIEVPKISKNEIATSTEIEPFNLEIEEARKPQGFTPIIPRVDQPKLEEAKSTLLGGSPDTSSKEAFREIKVEIPKTEETKFTLLGGSPDTSSKEEFIAKQTEIGRSPVSDRLAQLSRGDEMIPILTLKDMIGSGQAIDTLLVSPTTPSEVTTPGIKVVPPIAPSKSMSDIVPKTAMISSFSQDLKSAEAEKENTPVSKKHSYIKWVIISLALIFIGGMVFAFISGYIKILGSNFSFLVVKKDPKIIMLNTSANQLKLKSYKVDTNINISFPTLPNITLGLVSGDVVNSKDRDMVEIITKGIATHTGGNLTVDYLLNLKSSVLKKEISSRFKYNGSDLFVSVPDLSEIMGKDAPTAGTVSLNKNQLGLIIPLFSVPIQDKIKNFDFYDIISKGIPPYVTNELTAIFSEFISGLNSTQKGEESIKGIDTYRYEMTADRPQTKKFLISLANLFAVNLTADQKKDFDEVLGASSISAFEVWVSKNDDNLYRFKFTLNAPLSRVLGINDSGIAGNEVLLSWDTTYYDFNIPNNISLGGAEENIDVFIKKTKDQKIKNLVDGFKSETLVFKNAVGSFGSKLNPTGSCVNPASGSIFSPVGHPKGADTAIGSISSRMNSLLSQTNGDSSCFSSSKGWALSVPLFTQAPVLYYCIDSTGNTMTLPNIITGTICQ